MTPPAIVPDERFPALTAALASIASGRPLNEAAAEAAVREMVGGTAPAEMIAQLLLGLRGRGESDAEIAGAVRALRSAMIPVAHPDPASLVDTCGTGGGAVTTVNISTAAAFVAAGAGAVIAKHGNRSYTSRSGSADVLESLGVPIDLDAARAASVLAETGIVFLFAPNYHPALRHVGPIRRELKVSTLMNLVGPLANPAGAVRQVVGVGDPARAPAVAGALARLGALHALVVHADIGMDEFSPIGSTAVWEVRNGKVHEWQFDAGASTLGAPSLAGLEGGEPAENAAKMLQLLEDPGRSAPALRSAVLLNAAAAIYVSGLAASMTDAIELAVASLESGRARERLEGLRDASAARLMPRLG